MKYRETNDPTTRIVLGAMGRNGVKTCEKLAEVMNLGYHAAHDRLVGRTRWSLDDLRDLDRTFHFTDAEILGMVRGGGDNRHAKTKDSA
jgi:hypothetical protein